MLPTGFLIHICRCMKAPPKSGVLTEKHDQIGSIFPTLESEKMIREAYWKSSGYYKDTTNVIWGLLREAAGGADFSIREVASFIHGSSVKDIFAARKATSGISWGRAHQLYGSSLPSKKTIRIIFIVGAVLVFLGGIIGAITTVESDSETAAGFLFLSGFGAVIISGFGIASWLKNPTFNVNAMKGYAAGQSINYQHQISDSLHDIQHKIDKLDR